MTQDWEQVRLKDLDVDLSDWSDEYVEGFVAGADHALNTVGSDGEPLVFRLSRAANRLQKHHAEMLEALTTIRDASPQSYDWYRRRAGRAINNTGGGE